MDVPEYTALLANWPIEPPIAMTPLTGGTNNQAWQVDLASGSSYVLRLTSGVADQARFQYETALLTALSDRSLPFRVPLPLQALNGERFALVERENAEPALATLTPFLPGHLPERTVANCASDALALAQLDAALATIPESSLPSEAGEPHFIYGDLYHCHPLVPDPPATVARLLDSEQASQLTAILEQSQLDWEAPAIQALPQQLLHRDVGPGNILMAEGRVTAILDFEFAGPDRRIFDLCVAISWWPVRLMGTGREWEMIDAFGQAYTAHFPLADEELQALPAVLRMRDTTSLVYRIGRYLAGLESMQTIHERVRHSFWRESWLAANRETLVRHALAWNEGRA